MKPDELDALLLNLYQYGKNEVKIEIYLPKAKQALTKYFKKQELEARIDELLRLAKKEALATLDNPNTGEPLHAVPLTTLNKRYTDMEYIKKLGKT